MKKKKKGLKEKENCCLNEIKRKKGNITWENIGNCKDMAW